MSATTVTFNGTPGDWGIDADETENGLIIESINDDQKSQKKYTKNRVGNRVGRVDYDESMEINFKALLTPTTPFVQKLAAALTLANALTADSLNVSGGDVLIDDVNRTREGEGWKGITVKAEMLPYF